MWCNIYINNVVLIALKVDICIYLTLSCILPFLWPQSLAYIVIDLSISPSRFCPEHNFKTVQGIDMKLRREFSLRRSAVHKNHNSRHHGFGVIALCEFSFLNFVWSIMLWSQIIYGHRTAYISPKIVRFYGARTVPGRRQEESYDFWSFF